MRKSNEKKSKLSGTDIIIRGARVHNLKNINLKLPRYKLIIFTGVSGSGKSSLAFDTIYAEGQRRFVESLSSYARQFLERMDKPDVDFIEGLSPAIAIEQKTSGRNPRSTVATSTEIYDYLRLLFARIGKTYCHRCSNVVRKDTVSTVIEKLTETLNNDTETRLFVMFPLKIHPKATIYEELDNLRKQGFIRIMCDEQIIELTEKIPSKICKADISVVVDRLILRKNQDNSRLAESIETAFKVGSGNLIIKYIENGSVFRFNQHYNCAECGIEYEEPDPRLFSFNSPYGACNICQGFGRSTGIDLDLVIPDTAKTIREGAIQPWTTPKWKKYLKELIDAAPENNLNVDVPYSSLSSSEIDLLLNGGKGFDGIYDFFRYIEKKSYKVHYRYLLSRYRGYTTCENCKGSRLRKEALQVKIRSKTILDIVKMTVDESHDFFVNLPITDVEYEISKRILEEIKKRIKYLVDIGLGYLTLDRLSNTLSGGESQRINLATSLGSTLVDSLYVLDEPTIGLHPKDNRRLIKILKSLRDNGNTVIIVEHDAEMMTEGDLIVDMGPGAGVNGGEVIFKGKLQGLKNNKISLTGKYLSNRLKIPIPSSRRNAEGNHLFISGAREHNLKNIDVEIPLNKFVCITGVSGSGKSTLVMDVLYPALKKINRQAGDTTSYKHGTYKSITGHANISDVELVDQSPIGRTPRSNAATFMKIFDTIRDLFSKTQAAKIHGFTPGHFSFNVTGGRCDVCEGSGIQIIEMQFLADLQLICDACKGKRFKKEILEIKYKGKNIDDILKMTVNEATVFFKTDPAAKKGVRLLEVLVSVGLGYIRLGQPATTLSGGEAQRIKLAAHLSASSNEKNKLFIFDEPTTGLHFDDILKLLKCFNSLIDTGNSVVIIEHHLDVIKCADWIIDLGPDAGKDGGTIVAQGTPEDIVKVKKSHTGRFLNALLSD